jgi:hypothetical protein
MAEQDVRDEPLERANREDVLKRFVLRLDQGLQFDGERYHHPHAGHLNVATSPDNSQQPNNNNITSAMRDNFRRIFNDLHERQEHGNVLGFLHEIVSEEIQRERYLAFVHQCVETNPSHQVSFQDVANKFDDTIENVQEILNPDCFLQQIDQLRVYWVS